MTGLLALLLAAHPVLGATLPAGPGTQYPLPSAAIAAAQPGDVVAVAPGTYFDCASWRTDRLTIEGHGAVFSDRICADKAMFVVGGADTVVRGLVFTHARSGDGNGAGIRMEGGDLLVEDCVFDDDQAALVASGAPGARLVLRRVTVRGVGVPGQTLAAVTVGAIASVRLEDSRFSEPKGDGGAVRTEAPAEIAGSRFGYGPGPTPVVEAYGPLAVTGASFHLSGTRPAALRASGPSVAVRDTQLESAGGALLLQDWSDGTPVLAGNRVGAGDTETSSAGALLHRAKDTAHGVLGALRHTAGRVRRMLP